MAVEDGTSWIDHNILLHSSAQTLVTPVKVELGSYWLTCTDPGQVRTTRPLTTTSFRRRDLHRRDKEAVTENQEALIRDLGQLPDLAGLSMEVSDSLLQDISNKSLHALPGKKLSNIKTHRYKDGWSPCLVALAAHCRAISRISYHLRGFGKGKWWTDSTEQSAGIRLAVEEWGGRCTLSSGWMGRFLLRRGSGCPLQSGG